MAINNITGSPVEGENFFGREKELEYAWNHIKKGNSLILSAPRRVGKSSFAKKLLENAKKEGWKTLEINLEQINSEEGFIRLFVEELNKEKLWKKTYENVKDVFQSILETVNISTSIGSVEFKSKKANIYDELKKQLNHSEKTLIMVDEVTILLNCLIKNDIKNGKTDVTNFMNWLRGLRQITGTQIKWVFCSSIGIDNFTSVNGLSYTINDIESYPIGEFSETQTTAFIKELAKSENIKFSKSEISYFINKLGWNLPYFIQILFSNINMFVKVQGHSISNETIDNAFNLLLDKKHLATWKERLSDYGEYKTFAELVLKQLSKHKEGETRDNIFNTIFEKIREVDKTDDALSTVIQMLKNDGYIIFSKEDKYVFRSPLLRDFWYNQFVR